MYGRIVGTPVKLRLKRSHQWVGKGPVLFEASPIGAKIEQLSV